MRKTKASYTLSELRSALRSACAEQGMSVPSLVTIKNWSAEGAFRKTPLIHDAVKVVIARMLLNPGAYRLQTTQTNQSGQAFVNVPSEHEEWLKAEIAKRMQRVRPQHSHPDDDEGGDDPLKLWGRQQPNDDEQWGDEASGYRSKGHISSPDDLTRRIASPDDLTRRIVDLENQMKLVRHDIREAIRHLEHQAGLAAGKDSLNPALAQAIGQLDALRKHIMQRMDAEMQIVKNFHAAHQTQAAPSDSNSRADHSMLSDIYMAMQQILSKLSRMESRVQG